jgi:hypothetical protein
MSLTIEKKQFNLATVESLEVGQCFESCGEYFIKINEESVYCFTTKTVDTMDRHSRVRPVDLYAIER